jgi:hypothetical protein
LLLDSQRTGGPEGEVKYLDELWEGKFEASEPLFSDRLGIAAVPQSHSDFGKQAEFDEAFRRYTQGDPGRGFDFVRIWSLALNCEYALSRTGGCVAELGVYKGHCGALLSLYAEKYGRKMYLCDTFQGFAENQYEVDMGEGKKAAFKDVSLESAKTIVGDYAGNRWIVGMFPDSITDEMRSDRFAFVSIDCDIYDPIRHGLNFFWPRMDVGGVIFIHDYGSGYWPGAVRAVDEFCAERSVAGSLLSDLCGTYVLARSGTGQNPEGA